jgi:raffinose/stachyose/melibiose transport system permease protein
MGDTDVRTTTSPTTATTTTSPASDPLAVAAEAARAPRQIAQRRARRVGARAAVHAVLIGYTVLALGPALLVVANSVKERSQIFDSPFSLPTPSTWDTSGYDTVFDEASFLTYFRNSLVVTLLSVLGVLAVSAMAAHGLSEFTFRGRGLLRLYLLAGIMVPIRLATVGLVEMFSGLQMINTLWALILVYIAMGIPLGVFILSQFFEQVPSELKQAARVDGAGEWRVFAITLPLVRPGLGAVAVFTMLPVFNDLWFPLVLAPSDSTRTVTLGAQQFLGQFETNWNAMLAALSLAIVPVLVLYILFSRQFLRGLTEGAIK